MHNSLIGLGLSQRRLKATSFSNTVSPVPCCFRMHQRKMLQSSKGALLLLLPCLGGLVLGEVGDFSHCLRFFYKRAPPEGIDTEGYRPICQRYKNQYRFASLYHSQRRTPLYSAYTLTPAAGKRPKNIWKYEPQVRETKYMYV